MPSRRRCLALFSAVAAAATCGCRAAGFDSAARLPEPIALGPALDAEGVVARANDNARRITSVRANSSIKVEVLAERKSYGVRGTMAMEPPKDFRLRLETPGMGIIDVADLGSNDREFWFWVKDNKDKAIYVCEYDSSGESPLASALQPDWIVESMGLRVIPDDEAASMKARREGANTILTSQRKGAGGETLVKETVVDTATKRVVAHRLYGMQGGRRTILAEAVIGRSKEVRPEVPKGDEDADNSPLTVPEQIVLTWHQQKLRMDIHLSDVRLNKRFTDEQRAEMFSVPTIRNVARKNLKDLPEFAAAPPAAAVRETRPVPVPAPARQGRVKLGDPAPIGVEGAYRSRRDSVPLGPDLQGRSGGAEAVIGARVPRPTEAFSSEADAWRTASNPSFER